MNVQMVSIANPQVPALKRTYTKTDYFIDMDSGGSYWKLALDTNREFASSKKGFLWNLYDFVAILPPAFPAGIDLDDLDRRISQAEPYSDEDRELRERRAQLYMNARLQPLIDAGYVRPEEIDDGIATKQFVATVLYRVFGEIRPYHGGIDLKDSDDTAVRWAVEVGLPGFVVDSKGYLYPHTPLSMEPGPFEHPEEYAYERLSNFITLVLPGKKTANGWEYYQVKLLPGMVPAQARELIYVNGKPYISDSPFDVLATPEYDKANKAIRQYFISRFPQMLEQARKDALKPRVWDWSRDLIHHPRFAKEISAYRKSKTNKNVNAVYQAVRQYYNLTIAQDSAANIKSVLDHVK
ncbi:hypothetical protein ACFSO0_09775 [Brevibacillus sp. GCM10020057]|uniref:hypothetical protein n=1 Tax=Brevibacillus sp. GCM10020057 TaxID=3317327 RepID=UPI0036412FEE